MHHTSHTGRSARYKLNRRCRVMWLIILSVLLLAGGVIIFFLNRRGSGVDDKRPIDLTYPMHSGRYWGVRLAPSQSGTCCALVRQLQGRNFAKDQVPPLPLPGCTILNCRCHYQHLPEGRKGYERRSGKDTRLGMLAVTC